MTDITDFNENLKAKLDELKEKTLSNLLNKDKEYQQYCKEHCLAEDKYLKLKLTTEEKEVIDNLLAATDISDMEYSTLSYVAGIYDSHKYFHLFDFEEKTQSPKNNIINEFYLGNLIPCEHDSESPKTKKYWKKLVKKKYKFISSLTENQKSEYEQFFEAQMIGTCMRIEDSFVYGFQIGSQFMIETFNDR